MKVTLNEVEERLVTFLAKKRMQANRANDIPDEQVGKQNKLAIEINGLGGELAFCKAANLYPDLSLASNPGTRPVGDAQLFGDDWDIKTTEVKGGRLLVRPVKKGKKECTYYILVVGRMPTYEIIGWAHKDEVFQDKNLKDLGHGDTYVLEQDQLKAVSWLKDL